MIGGSSRPPKLSSLDLFNAELKKWPIMDLEQALRHMDDAVGADADEVIIEGGVMDLRQSDAVADDRLAKLFITIRDDVRGIEQARFRQLGNGAAAIIGCKHPFAKRDLMEPLLDQPKGVTGDHHSPEDVDPTVCWQRHQTRSSP